MLTRGPYTATNLIACVRKSLDLCDGDVRLTPIPTGKFNDSYYVSTDGGEYVLRVAPDPEAGFLFYEKGMMKQEPVLHRLLREQTSAPVAEVLDFDDSHSLIDRDYLLMERLPGQPLSDDPACDPDAVLRQVGAALAEAHGVTADRYGYLGPHEPMAPQETWRDAFRAMWGKLIADIVACGHYSEQEAEGFVQLFDHYQDAFDYDGPARLLHMDVWAQNILVGDDGRLSGLVDWDRAVWGDPEIEFAVLDYCGVSRPAFWEGYGRSRPDSPASRIRHLFYYLYELQKYIVIRQARQGNPSGAAQYKRQTLRILKNSLQISPP